MLINVTVCSEQRSPAITLHYKKQMGKMVSRKVETGTGFEKQSPAKRYSNSTTSTCTMARLLYG